MKTFIVENGSGSTVAQGHVEENGDVSFSHSSLSLEDQSVVIKEIKVDIEAGHSGGRLSIKSLQWLEVMSREG